MPKKQRSPFTSQLEYDAGSQRRSAGKTALLTFLFAAFAAGGLFFGCIFVTTLADLLSNSPVGTAAAPLPLVGNLVPKPKPPQLVPSAGTPVPGALPGAVPGAAPSSSSQLTPTPDAFAGVPAWSSADRINILLLGLDMRDDERDQPTRSDTMIILTIDPAHKRAGMLSIPRDLWVPIPGHGQNKINTGHFFGEADQPGGGPALAMKTVEYNFGVKINYYARVDFRGFADLLDAIGGVTIDVERPIKDDEYPTEDYGIRRLYISTGIQHMSGPEALRFARSRHADNDFARGHRQQSVILAARQKVLQPSILPKIPAMVGILFNTVKTDVPVTDMLSLFKMGQGIQAKDIVSRAIDPSMTIDVNGDGTVLVPDRKKIRKVMDEVFSDTPVTPAPTTGSGDFEHPSPSTPVPTLIPAIVLPATSTATPKATPTTGRATPTRVAANASITVQVYNGTLREHLAADVASALRLKGYSIGEVAQAARADYTETIIRDHTGHTQAANAIAQLLGVPTTAVKKFPPVADGADITIVLGADAQLPR